MNLAVGAAPVLHKLVLQAGESLSGLLFRGIAQVPYTVRLAPGLKGQLPSALQLRRGLRFVAEPNRYLYRETDWRVFSRTL